MGFSVVSRPVTSAPRRRRCRGFAGTGHHRYGGMVTSQVPARVPDWIASVVYLDAFMPEPDRSLVSYAHGSTQADETLRASHALVHGIDVPPMSMEDMGVTDQAGIDHVEARVSPHPIKTMIQAFRAFPDWPDIPVTYVYGSGTKVPTFEPFLQQLDADPRVDTHIVASSHVLTLTAPNETFDILANVRTGKTQTRTAA